MEPLPGLVVRGGLTDTQVAELAAAVRDGVQPRVRVRESAGQVAGRRGRVVAVGDQRAVGAECLRVRLDGDGDVLPFAPHELALISRPRPGRGRASDGATGLPENGARRDGVFPVQTRSLNAPQPGWTLQRALDRLAQGYSVRHVAELSGYAQPFLQAHLRLRRRHRHELRSEH